MASIEILKVIVDAGRVLVRGAVEGRVHELEMPKAELLAITGATPAETKALRQREIARRVRAQDADTVRPDPPGPQELDLTGIVDVP